MHVRLNPVASGFRMHEIHQSSQASRECLPKEKIDPLLFENRLLL